ncbi:MAG TPA: glutamine--fructose-6-phosphate transaminase (isomerizing) [Rhizobiales bacterium]|nr:glutamine--fructose-6-phosphate transaminase (isomerizing) [Hyphomicrobiales bacterium]
MCGIIGIAGNRAVARRLVESLKRLEYRGYDSAGIAVLDNGELNKVRTKGKLQVLEAEICKDEPAGTTGIGHTRWATHGAPTVSNAHPHEAGRVSIVHNGIIENFKELKDELAADGVEFATQTDTEVVAHLINRQLEDGATPVDAVKNVLGRLTGAFAFAIVFRGEQDLLIGARRGSPLAIGHGEGENYLGSDAIALAPLTSKVTYLADGDMAVLTPDSVQIFDETGAAAGREMQFTQASAMMVDKAGYRHFMAKEIAEQPDVIAHTLSEYTDFSERTVSIPGGLGVNFKGLDRITITACGTAFYAGLVAKYWFEKYARIPVDVDIASEFRYRDAPLGKNGLSLVISQSGETADTLAALRYCKAKGQHVACVVNVPESTIARESDTVLRTFAGPEIGVASTKAFTCQLAVLACLAIHAGVERGLVDMQTQQRLVGALGEVPRRINKVFESEDQIEAIARKIAHARDILYLGRGINFPIAMEGALKMKEISYIHAEGYAAGELKHGPIALVDEDVPVVVIAPRDELYEKTVSNMLEVAARGAQVVLVTDHSTASEDGYSEFETIAIPASDCFISPFLYAIPMQLLSYHAAVFMGTDVDQPRNLAKSVTVE